MALLADLPPASQIIWLEGGMLGDPRQHPRANFIAIMEYEETIRIV
jgi:hypothetical protein